MVEVSNELLSRRRILVVEDEYFLADEFERGLRGLGASVAGPVATLAGAREELDAGRPIDGAVLDVQLHDHRSEEIADQLKARGIPFVFTTGYDRSVMPERHRDVAHFQKPCDIDRVLRTLADLLQ